MNIAQFNIEYLVIIFMAVIILYLLYYVYSKDAQYSKNIRSVANVVEELNRELFYLKKNLNKAQTDMQTDAQRMTDDVIYQEIERNVYDMVHSSMHGNDDAKILSLFQQGVSLETISKELHISQPEVEFVLKINKIK